jgi:hypothetical protein
MNVRPALNIKLVKQQSQDNHRQNRRDINCSKDLQMPIPEVVVNDLVNIFVHIR